MKTNFKSIALISALTMISSMNLVASEGTSYSASVSLDVTGGGLSNGVFYFVNLSKGQGEYAYMNYGEFVFLASNGEGQQNTSNPISGNRSFTTYNAAFLAGTTIGLVYSPTHLAGASSTHVVNYKAEEVIEELENYEATGEISDKFKSMIDSARITIGLSEEVSDEQITELFAGVVTK